MTRLRAGIVAALCLAAADCATGTPRSSAEGPRPGAPRSEGAVVRPPRAQIGTASWYGDRHHGKKTASGEVYDISDRGPSKPGRIIDLSQAAARALGALGAGLVTVRLEVAPAGGSR